MLLAAAVLARRRYEDAFKISPVHRGAVNQPVCRWRSIAEPAQPPVGCQSGVQSGSHGLPLHSRCPKACSRLSQKQAGVFFFVLFLSLAPVGIASLRPLFSPDCDAAVTRSNTIPVSLWQVTAPKEGLGCSIILRDGELEGRGCD